MRDRVSEFWREYRFAAVNLVIVALQVIVFAVNTVLDGALFAGGRLTVEAVVRGHEYWRLFTVVFLHLDFPHLMGNIVGQLAIGNLVEKNIGHLRFLVLYVFCTIGSDLTSMAHAVRTYWTGGSVGSSGAVFGLMGALVVLIFLGTSREAARLRERALFMLVYAVYIGFQSTNVDNAAHVGGLLTGILVMLAMSAVSGSR